MNYLQNQSELFIHLKDTIHFMISSGISFDKGYEGEAKRMAISIRILVHHTSKSSALLSQLGVLDNILFYDSATPFYTNNLLSSNCLTIMKLTASLEGKSSTKDVAPLDSRRGMKIIENKTGFNRWWNTQIVLKDQNRTEFHRKTIVLAVADQDGGAHVDATLDESYAKLSRLNSLGWKSVDNNGTIRDCGNPVPACIRQINHEMLKTLKDYIVNVISPDDEIYNELNTYNEHCKQLSVLRSAINN